MTKEKLEMLKHLFDEHFTHEDWLIAQEISLTDDEVIELRNHILEHPHSKVVLPLFLNGKLGEFAKEFLVTDKIPPNTEIMKALKEFMEKHG